MERTVTLPLPPNPAISATVRQFNEATNYFLKIGFENRTYSRKRLQALAYRDVRYRWPHLQSSLVHGARDCACDMLKRERCKRLPVKRSAGSARFNQRTFKVYLDSCIISLSTVDGRVRVPIHLPEYFRQYSTGKVVSLRVREDRNRLWVDIVVRLPDISIPPPSPASIVMGVDRGIVNIAVTSDGSFFNSSALRHVRGRYAYLRARLQAAGTRSARRHLRRLSGRERRFQRNCNHIIARKIASRYFEVLALEHLSVRKDRKLGRSFNRKLGGWSYAQLEAFLRYKCEAKGKSVVLVNPAYTSQDCSRCGRRGERAGSSFHCPHCGLFLNADLNAARNIAHRGMSLICRPNVNGPIVARGDAWCGNYVDLSDKPPVLTGG